MRGPIRKRRTCGGWSVPAVQGKPNSVKRVRLHRHKTVLLSAFLAAACALLAGPGTGSAQPAIKPQPKEIKVTARPLASFLIGAGDKVLFGELEWLGGMELIASNRHFGSLSGVSVSEDGETLLAVTDNGFWVRGTIDSDADGAPTALSDVRIAPMLDDRGRVLNLKASADAESVERATLAGKPVYLVAFERNHRVRVYDRTPDAFPGKPGPFPTPRAIRNLRANKGLESIAVGLQGSPSEGLTVMIAERARKSGGDIPAWVSRPGGGYRAFHVLTIDEFDITDAAFLPDGDLLLLERRFSYSGGIFMRLRRIAGHDIRTRKRAIGRIIMVADFTHQIDNMEGLAVHRSPAGDIVLTIVSDDNRSILQRNLLLRFRLRNPTLETRPQPRPTIPTAPASLTE